MSLIIGARFTSNNYFKFLLSAIVVLPTLILLILQPDIGQTLLISSVWLSLIFVSGINLYFLNFLILFSLSILSFLIFIYLNFHILNTEYQIFLIYHQKVIINLKKQLMQSLMEVFLEKV